MPSFAPCEAGLAHDVAQAGNLDFHEFPQFIGRGRVDRDQPLALPLAQSGKVRMLGVTTKERVGAIPDVPPLAEIGVPGYDAASWWLLVAPAKTPRSIVDKLHADLRVVLREPDVREEFIQRQGLIPVDSPAPDQLRKFVEVEIARLGDIVRRAGLAGSE